MADSAIITAADYADAMITARRAKNWLFLLLLVVLLIQLGTFLAARYTTIIFPSATTYATTQSSELPRNLLKYLIDLTDFLGIALAVVLSMVVLLIVNIMLVGRLVGVARATSAYVWALVLLVLLFPWQAFLDPYNFKIPGVLYTWSELMAGARLAPGAMEENVLRWGRFIVLPAVALIILLAVQVKVTRGVKQALGEADGAAGEPT